MTMTASSTQTDPLGMGLQGKHALITGGSHGIGLATARALADAGCHVAICARNEERLADSVRELKKSNVQVLGLPADAMVPADIRRVVDGVIGAWGALNILVNNVGGGGRWGSSVIEDTEDAVWLDVFNKNVMAAVRFTRLAIPYMRRQKWGRVVTVASIHGYEGGGRPWFNMAKRAQISLMKTLAMRPDLARDGLTFNTVAPGSLMIPDTGWDHERQKDPEGFGKQVLEQFPLGRLGTAEEVASIIAFVCSEKASLLNGATIVVDGGESRSF